MFQMYNRHKMKLQLMEKQQHLTKEKVAKTTFDSIISTEKADLGTMQSKSVRISVSKPY